MSDTRNTIQTRRSEKAGLPPGTPVYIGKPKEEKVRLTVMDYDQTSAALRTLSSVEECLSYRNSATVSWINVDGLHDIGIIERIGQIFNLHPLVVEDIVNTHQRPKLDIHEGYLFLVAKMLTTNESTGRMEIEQISIVLGDSFVLSFQEKPGDIFDPVRARIRDGKGRIRHSGPDYLMYSLLDQIVDGYFEVLEMFSDQAEGMEEEVLENPSPASLNRVHFLKREMAFLRRSTWPLREVITALKRQESPLIADATVIYLSDLYDHTIQVIDTVETLKDLVSVVLDIYLSSISNRMNEIMKVLTIFATIFIPLTFIAGLYGMNFNPTKSPYNMPELNWYYGYPFALGLMAAVLIIMLLYFKRKKWF